MKHNVANVAVVGMGQWGKNLVRNMRALGALRTVCDNDRSREATVRAEYPGVAFEPDYRSLLRDESISAVVLATPAPSHFAMAKAALEVGKDVLVEKPMALHVDEGKALVELADRSERILMVGHVLRYHPAVVKLEELIREGQLGKIQYLYSNRLNIGRIRAEENILWSFAPHDISIMLALLNEQPSSIACQGGAYLTKGVPDVTLSQFVFPSGVHAHIFVNWLNPFKEQRLVVVGTERMAVFDDAAPNKLVLYPHKIEWKNRLPQAIPAEANPVALSSSEPLFTECEHFLNCLATRKQPLTDGPEGLRVLTTLHACQQALEGQYGSREMDTRTMRQPPTPYFVHDTARVDEGCTIGAGTMVWHYSHVMKGARIGAKCVLGQNCHVADGAVIGNNVKVQNNVSLYAGTILEDDVFLGPSCVLTNVTNPRSQVSRQGVYEKTLLRRGATVGANATIVCGVELGRYAFIAAGAVVVSDVPDYALMTGVPAKQVGWMSRHGHRLTNPDTQGVMICPESEYQYQESTPGVMRCLDLDEEAPLPHSQAVGRHPYQEYHRVNA